MDMPKLRFKADDGSDFPNWESITLGKLGTFQKGAPFSKSDISETGTPFILYGELFSTYNEVTYSVVNYTTKTADLKYYSKISDVLIPTSNCVPGHPERLSSATCVMKEGVILAGDLLIFRPVNWIDGRIISCIINHQIKISIARVAQGNPIVHVKASDLSGISAHVPTSQAEQRKITEFLDAIDDIIAKQQAEIATWEQYKKGVVQKLFSQEVRFKADDGSDFPDWESITLGELGTFQKGAPLSKEDISYSGTPFILYGELFSTYNEVANYITNHTEKIAELKYYSKIGDVLIPTSNCVPGHPERLASATCVMQDGVILAGDLLIYRPINGFDGRILSYIINYQIKHSIARVAQGNPIVHVKPSDLSGISANVPTSPEEQRKIVECLDAIDDVIALAKAELEKWRELKKGLLQELFV